MAETDDVEYEDDGDPHLSIPTARRGQRLSIDGWFASHADSGTPGPHLRLCGTDRQDPVIRTGQVPDLVNALRTVAGRIDELWAREGDDYAANVVLRSPDPQDDEVIRQRHVDHLVFGQRLADNLAEVARLLAHAGSTDEALVAIGALLDVDEAEVMVRLARFDMLSLTRPAYERRAQLLREYGVS